MGALAKRGVVFQIWRSFIIFILLPVVLLNIAIFYMLYDMENTTKRMASTNLAHAQFLLDQNITDSLASLEKIGNNYHIQKMSGLELPLTGEDFGTLLEVRKLQQTMMLSNDVYSLHILCNGSNIALIDNELCVDLNQYYPASYAFGSQTVENLKASGHRGRQLAFYHYSRFRRGEVTEYGIFYKAVLTPYAGEESGATAIVFLKEASLKGILGEVGLKEGLTYIMDAGGQILYKTGDTFLEPLSFPLENTDGTVQVLSKTYFGKRNSAFACSTTGGLQLVSLIPESSLYMQMGGLRFFIWILNATTVFMCLFLSFLLARKRSQILSRTLELVDSEESGESNVFSAIYHSVSTMVETNTSLKMELGSQKELLKSVFWNRILSVNTMSDEEISHLALSAGIADADGYCLLVAGFGVGHEMGAEDWNLLLQKRQSVLEEISQDPGLEAYVGTSGMDQLVFLFPLSKEKQEDYQKYVMERAQTLQKMMEEEPMLVCVGSMVFENLRDIYGAYTMCGNQMNLLGGYLDNRTVIWCGEEQLGTESTFYYTDELKNQLVLWIKTGQQELVKDGFRKILEENYFKRRISGDMEQLLVAKLKLTLLGAYDNRMTMDLGEVFAQIDKIQTDAWLFSYILRVAMDMCGHYLTGIRSHEDGLQKKIVAYIEEHVMEYGFGLSAIADHCNLSETYFSQIFKEIMGENFSTYVEKKRMEHAYRLIVESDRTIDQVAEETGYSNTNAFRKAYKRYYGVTPSQSRQNRGGL